MRFEGTLIRWNDERGYGFIAPQPGAEELFVHISAFARGGQPPRLNERLTFEVALDRQGKKQAVAVRRPMPQTDRGAAARLHTRHRPPERASRGPAVWLVLACALLAAVYGLYHARRQAAPVQEPPAPTAVARAPDQAPVLPAAVPAYRCDGRQYCSQMTSCAEAKFFLKNCPDPRMDGNGDGVPCEQQWCTHPLSP